MSDLPRKLLLVEDSSDDEVLSLRGIKRSGILCTVSVVRDGGMVLALLQEEGPAPDLIVLDYHLPHMNGFEILRELRANEKTRLVPVVLLSAQESDAQIEECLRYGANSCVGKPSDPFLYVENVAQIARYWLTIDKHPKINVRRPE